jgi:hypothetical protein
LKVLSFDLNTRCTGVFGIILKDKEVVKVMSSSIVVEDFDLRRYFPFMKSKKKLPTKPNGHGKLNTYYRPGEKHVSKTEKKKRDRIVRNKRNEHQIESMSKSFYKLLDNINPDKVLIEKNEMFRGILTIEVLAKLTGTLIGQCSGLGIDYELFNVNTVRKPYNVSKLVKEFSKTKSDEEIAGEEDLSKAAIRWFLQDKYKHLDIDLKTLDESDAALVFDYWFENIFKEET